MGISNLTASASSSKTASANNVAQAQAVQANQGKNGTDFFSDDSTQQAASTTDLTTNAVGDNTNGSQPNSKNSVKAKVEKVTDRLNDLMDTMDTNLHFKLHYKTDELMVQVYDEQNKKLLREWPPHEFLDMMAKIHELEGTLVDKKA